MKDRSMVKLIHADDFFPEKDVQSLLNMTVGLNTVITPYGSEIEHINLIYPDIETIFYHVLGERVTVDPALSGTFRRPHLNAIHFESFASLSEWCFFVALERTVVNFWHHVNSDHGVAELQSSAHTDARQGVDYNYHNLFEWKIHTNITLEANQGLFFRPWLFHSLESGMVQYYKLLADPKYRILVMGLPNSSKKSISEKLHARLEHSELIHSMEMRVARKDLDFAEDGQLRHSYRLLETARKSAHSVVIINMAAPLEKTRQILNPDFLIYATDGTTEAHRDLSEIYSAPQLFDHACDSDSDTEIDTIVQKILTKRVI